MRKILKVKLLVVLLVVCVVLLEGIHIYLSNRIAGTSIEVARLRQKIEVLDEKNTSLKSQLLSYSSIEYISSRAAELGFSDNKDTVIMLKAPLQVAVLP